MKIKQTIKSVKWSWVSAIVAVFIVAFVAGCNSDDATILINDADRETSIDVSVGVTQPDEDSTNAQPEDEECDFLNFEDFDMVVATVNGIDITASAVINEFSWAINSLVMEYIAMFPEDTDFDFDRPFGDDMTFGRAVREEAVGMAAHVALYQGFAATHDLPWEMEGFQHPVITLVEAIIEDPELFALFESYLQPDTSYVYEEKAEELLARALAGEDFAALIQTYGEDPGMAHYTEGYTFVRGDMVSSFEEATIALEIGEISGLVWSDFGIHIIKRVAPEPNNIMQGSRAPEDVAEEDLLAAMHILISTPALSPEDRLFDAVFSAFEEKLQEANIEFLPTLDDVPFPSV